LPGGFFFYLERGLLSLFCCPEKVTLGGDDKLMLTDENKRAIIKIYVVI
jgi:hypothetical protein